MAIGYGACSMAPPPQLAGGYPVGVTAHQAALPGWIRRAAERAQIEFKSKFYRSRPARHDAQHRPGDRRTFPSASHVQPLAVREYILTMLVGGIRATS